MAADAGLRECLIAPSAATVGAATLSTRAAPDRSPTSRRRRPRSPLRRSFFSIAACTDKIAGVVGAPWFCARTARRWMSEVRMPRGLWRYVPIWRPSRLLSNRYRQVAVFSFAQFRDFVRVRRPWRSRRTGHESWADAACGSPARSPRSPPARSHCAARHGDILDVIARDVAAAARTLLDEPVELARDAGRVWYVKSAPHGGDAPPGC